ncbi:ubiquitin carboxyl-terminal hydrolase-like protein isozyme L3 [Bisporella sp. PMI_857]|nr:ubiquitin carboxyl-terminal hydrolase-like protein isozyme L3 [Bisporella sp. PMI_857]
MTDIYTPAVIHNGKKTFTVLENNPEVMNALASKLGINSVQSLDIISTILTSPGLSQLLKFHDVYSLTEHELLASISRPVYALLVILPLTPAWHASREAEDKDKPEYTGKGASEPVIWFKQTLGHACGSIGLLHCTLNGDAAKFIEHNSFLEKFKEEVLPLGMHERAQRLYDSKDFEIHHQSVASLGDTAPPSAADGDRLGQHFVAFVKGTDGHLYELEGSRKGPIDRGVLTDNEDVLSPRALELGISRVMKLDAEAGGSDLRFSATALAPAFHNE